MKRAKVYKLIDKERDYQNSKWDGDHSDSSHSIADWILFMEDHLAKAKKHIYMLEPEFALEQIRKVTALGVACMEYNETKPRA